MMSDRAKLDPTAQNSNFYLTHDRRSPVGLSDEKVWFCGGLDRIHGRAIRLQQDGSCVCAALLVWINAMTPLSLGNYKGILHQNREIDLNNLLKIFGKYLYKV